MSSKLLSLLEEVGDGGSITRKAVSQLHHAASSHDHQGIADLLTFCAETLEKNPRLLTTEEVWDIVERLCFPVTAAWSSDTKRGDREADEERACQTICQFLASFLSPSLGLAHASVSETVRKACMNSLLHYREDVLSRDQACHEYEDEEVALKRHDLSIASAVAILTVASKKYEPSQENPLSQEVMSWWADLSNTVVDILAVAEPSVCMQLAQLIVPRNGAAPSGTPRHSVLEMIWNRLMEMSTRAKDFSEKVNENIYLILCALCDSFLPNSTGSDSMGADLETGRRHGDDLGLLESQTFWELIQQGLTHSNPLTRKRSGYLTKRAVNMAASLERLLGQGSQEVSQQPLFSWNPSEKDKLLRLWLEFFLIYETLDEVQIHVVTPVLPRLAHITKATYCTGGTGMPALHSSWLCILFQRCFVHESKTITRLGVAECLRLELSKSSFLQQNGLQFVLGPLLTALHEEYLYTKSPDMAPGSHPPIGNALKKFLPACVGLLSDKDKSSFLGNLLALICEQSWGPVTITFLAEALAAIPACSAWGLPSLYMLRDKISSGFLTCPTGYRVTIQCLLLRAGLHLLDWSAISLHQLSSLVGACCGQDVLKRGSPLWAEVSQTISDHMLHLVSLDGTTSASELCASEVKGYLHVDPSGGLEGGNDLPNFTNAQRVAATVLLIADGESQRRLEQGEEKQDGFITTVLQPLVDVVGRAGSHVYLPTLKVDKSLQVLLALLQESRSPPSPSEEDAADKGDGISSSMTSMLCQILDELFQYLIRQLLCEEDLKVSYITRVSLYRSVLDAILDHTHRVSGGQSKSPAGQRLCAALMEGQKLPVGAHTALVTSLDKQTTTTHSVAHQRGYRCYTMAMVLHWLLKAETFCPSHQLPSVARLLASLLEVEGQMDRPKAKEDESAQYQQGLEGPDRGRFQSELIRTKWEVILAVIQQYDTPQRGNGSDPQVASGQSIAMETWQDALASCVSDMGLVSPVHSVPLLKCTALLVDKVADGNIPLCLEGLSASWCAVQDGWRSNLTFWCVYEAFIGVAFQPAFLQYEEGTEVHTELEKYTSKIQAQGETRLGMLNVLVSHLDSMLSQRFLHTSPHPDPRYDAMTIIRNISGILQEAALFGPVVSKSIRLMEDVAAYLIGHEELLSVRSVLVTNSNFVNPRLPRVSVINILIKIGASSLEGKDQFFEDFLTNLMQRDQDITPPRKSYIINSVVHRVKLRVWQAAIVILNFLSESSAPKVLDQVLRSMRAENQTSTRHLMEVFVVRLIQLYPCCLTQFWDYAAQVANCQEVSFSPLLMIIAHLGTVQPQDQREAFYRRAIPTVLPWTFVPAMALRTQSQVALFKMWQDCKEAGLSAVMDTFPGVAVCMDFTMNNSALHALRERMEGSFFLRYYHPIHHFSLETLFLIMPRLTLVTEDELVNPDLFLESAASPWRQAGGQEVAIPLYSQTDTLRTCTVKEKKKNASVKDAEIREELWTEDGSGDVQKKITPWKESHIPGFDPSEGQRSSRGHLVVVASLVDRIPNLGGLCRTCEIFGASCLVLGNLAYKDHQDFLSLSVSAERWLPLREVKPCDLRFYMTEMKKHGYTLVGVEQTANSQSLTNFTFPKRTMLLLGKEREGIPAELIQLLDVCVEIPQLGFIRSLNVHVSGALMIWEYTRQKLLQQ